MTALAHALVAAALATKTDNIPLLAVLNIGQHFVLDSIPHWDLGTNWRKRPKWITGMISIAETLIGIIVALWIFKSSAPLISIMSAIFFGLLPDWLEAPWYIFFAKADKYKPALKSGFWENLTYKIYKFENSFHTKAPFPAGVYIQIITVALFLYMILG